MVKCMNIKYIFSVVIFCFFIFHKTAFAVIPSQLDLDISSLSDQDLTPIKPLLVTKERVTKISDKLFVNSQVRLNKPQSENPSRKILKETVDKFLNNTKETIEKIRRKEISIPDSTLEKKILDDLERNEIFLDSSLDDLKNDKMLSDNVYLFITSHDDNTLIITRTQIKNSSVLEIDTVMSDPANILNTNLMNEGAVKRASVENIRSIARDVRQNQPLIKKISAFVISSTLESNYRRMGFKESPCEWF